ncbi:hypothetical protein LOTGIDRAFT_176806, partial [Lottia gigantea]
KADSDDSGTEEPGAEDDFYTQPELGCKAVRPVVNHKPDKLAERLTSLTIARDRGNVPEGLVDSLPPEVLLVVFKHLDDISLYTAGNVCTRWRQILDGETSEKEWKHFIQLRWPLFLPQNPVKCWKTIYTNLLIYLSQQDHQRAAIVLLQNGADVTIIDDQGKSPVDLAKSKKMKSTLKEAWTEATQKKITPILAPVRVPTREDCKSQKSKRRKGEVIFDGLVTTPVQNNI